MTTAGPVGTVEFLNASYSLARPRTAFENHRYLSSPAARGFPPRTERLDVWRVAKNGTDVTMLYYKGSSLHGGYRLGVYWEHANEHSSNPKSQPKQERCQKQVVQFLRYVFRRVRKRRSQSNELTPKRYSARSVVGFRDYCVCSKATWAKVHRVRH